MNKRLQNVDPGLLQKIRKWQDSGNDEMVNGLIQTRDPKVIEKIRKKGVIFGAEAGNIITFHETPVSKLAKIASLEGVIYIELSRKLHTIHGHIQES